VNATRGDILEKCASWDKPAATSMKYDAPHLPKSEFEYNDKLPFSV